MSSEAKPLCRNCKHFYNTWNPTTPYGCKAYGFKSQRIPSLVVKMNSGKECQGFELSGRKKAEKSPYTR